MWVRWPSWVTLLQASTVTDQYRSQTLTQPIRPTRQLTPSSPTHNSTSLRCIKSYKGCFENWISDVKTSWTRFSSLRRSRRPHVEAMRTCSTSVPERSTCPLSADERLLRNVGEREGGRADGQENRPLWLAKPTGTVPFLHIYTHAHT